MNASIDRLHQFGWCPFFQQQLVERELRDGVPAGRDVPAGIAVPARIVAAHRSGLELVTQSKDLILPLGGKWFELDPEFRPTVGDWVLLDNNLTKIESLLDRKSLFKRMGAGNRSELQLIAANIDILFVVTSCNDEFNLSRLERFLSLGVESSVETVVVLTKTDLAETPQDYVDALRELSSVNHVELVNALDPETLAGIRAWCVEGQTIALLGSSGVGKSTLVNSLSNAEVQLTGGVRDSDKHGRHTTSHRSLHLLPGGGLILDSPGMRELQLADSDSGLSELFDEIDAFAALCKFSDCSHESEPGCRVTQAIEQGDIDERRLASYRKLEREQQYANESIAERHKRVRDRGKMIKHHVATKLRS